MCVRMCVRACVHVRACVTVLRMQLDVCVCACVCVMHTTGCMPSTSQHLENPVTSKSNCSETI